MKRDFDLLTDNIRQFKYLFPNKDYHEKIVLFNFKITKIFRRVVLFFSLLIALSIIIAFRLNENIMYIFINGIAFFIFLLMGIMIYLIFLPRKKLFSKQYEEITQNNLHENYLILHNNYKKNQKRWNIIYGLEISIISLISLIIFIGDIINKTTNFGPLFIFTFLLFIILIPTIIINMILFKRFRLSQYHLEDEIEVYSPPL